MAETLSPQQLADEGNRAYRAGNLTEAVAAFEQAAHAYQAAGDTLTAAEMSNNAGVALLKGGDAAASLAACEGTDQVFASAGDIRRQGMALANQASALEALGRLPDALERFELASELLKQAGEKDYRAYVLSSISSIQLRTGKQLQALASMDSALENKEKLSWRERLLKKLLRIPFNMTKPK